MRLRASYDILFVCPRLGAYRVKDDLDTPSEYFHEYNSLILNACDFR